jgi:hypothetical protein
MRRIIEQEERNGLSAAVGRLTDGLTRLFSEHLALARAELKEDARAVGGNLARVMLFVPLVLVGYGFLCAALAMGLSAAIPLWVSLLVVGGLNLGVGGVGAMAAARRLQARPALLDESFSEAQRSAQALAAVARRPAAANGHGGEKRLGD